MDSGETILLVLCGFTGLMGWFRWYMPLLAISPLYAAGRSRLSLLALPAVCAAVLYWVLTNLAAFDVVGSEFYVLFYLVMGIAWVAIGMWAFRLFGLSAREDAIERRNPAALYAVSGALVALTLCFAGGNVGNGPGWWAVLHSAGLATAALFLLLWALNVVTHLFDVVTIDRDAAAGIRVGGLLIGMGLILGRAATGDWYTFDQMNALFVNQAGIVLFLAAAAFLVELLFRPTVERPALPVLAAGVTPAVAYVGAAVALITWGAGWAIYRG